MKTACIVVSKRSEDEFCTLSAITRPKMVNDVFIWKIHYFIQWCKCLQVAWKSQQPVDLIYSKVPICFHQSIHGIYSQDPVWVQFVYILCNWQENGSLWHLLYYLDIDEFFVHHVFTSIAAEKETSFRERRNTLTHGRKYAIMGKIDNRTVPS